MKMEIPLRPLAKAWQATQIAASDDEARPVLYRKALVEVFEDHGLRMVSTDSFMLVRAWVPFDLTGNTSSPFSSFTTSSEMLGVDGFGPSEAALFNMAQKIARLKSLRENGRIGDPAKR